MEEEGRGGLNGSTSGIAKEGMNNARKKAKQVTLLWSQFIHRLLETNRKQYKCLTFFVGVTALKYTFR